MTKDEANKITGGLSHTQAMPCPSFGLPAAECQTGSKLAKTEGTSCSICYAQKGHYRFGNVQKAQYRRLASLDHPDWIEAMIFLIEPHRWFRWMDSGDVQSRKHFKDICKVCEGTPHTNHWLPSQEGAYVKGKTPDNLVVRISVPKIGQDRPKSLRVLSAGVVRAGATCQKVDGQCGSCRKCWSRDIEHITYKAH